MVYLTGKEIWLEDLRKSADIEVMKCLNKAGYLDPFYSSQWLWANCCSCRGWALLLSSLEDSSLQNTLKWWPRHKHSCEPGHQHKIISFKNSLSILFLCFCHLIPIIGIIIFISPLSIVCQFVWVCCQGVVWTVPQEGRGCCGAAGGEREWPWANSGEGEGGRMGGIEEGEVHAGIGDGRGEHGGSLYDFGPTGLEREVPGRT